MSEYTTGDRRIGSRIGAYRIEQVIEQSALGVLFEAQHEETQSAYLLRVLNVAEARSPDVQRTYLAQLERHATHLMTLQHPSILPLVDFGMDHGVPYLAWPRPIMRPLSARLAQSGPPDVITVGRYLDQIATALEFGYQQATLHRNLSTDCVFLQLDGHILLADFGVRRLVELLGGGGQRYPFYGSLEACAPEQLRGERVDAYTDVYALGALTYHLLTGQPVFTGETLDAIIERHLYEQPMPLSNWRGDLPSGLEGVLAGALAKDPVHRFPRASAFANAYHEVVTPNNKMRVPLAAGVPAGVPANGPSAPAFARMDTPAPAPANGHRQPAAALLDSEWPHGGWSSGTLSAPPNFGYPETDTSNLDGYLSATSRSSPPRRKRRRLSRERIIVALVVVVALIGSGLFVLYGGSALRGGASAATGVVVFVDGAKSQPGHTDTLQIVLHGVSKPGSGAHYDAWLINQQDEHIIPLGTLAATDSTGQSYALSYPQAGADTTTGAGLLGLGDKIEVTLEQGTVTAPVGHVVLVGVFPPLAFVHIRHLLVSFPTTPGQTGLLVGVLEQTQELDAQATALQNAAASGKTATTQCLAQSIVDIIEGTRGAHYRPLDPACAALNVTLVGDGFGLLGTAPGDSASGYSDSTSGYIDGTTDHAALAATQSDATDGIRLHASHVEIAMKNIKGWVTQADQDALQLLAAPSNATALSELVQVCDYAYHGHATNPDQTINPVPGEAGAQTAYEHGQFMATLTLVPGS